MTRALRRSLLPAVCLLAMVGCRSNSPIEDGASGNATVVATNTAPRGEPVQFRAADGATVFAAYYPVANPKALILLFHQADSSKDEYAAIAPQLNREGYAALAVDQRAGGKMYGTNQTAAAVAAKGGERPDYLSALADVGGAITWARARQLPIILWGSSYSASLVFMAAPQAGDQLKGVVAFSPGEYFSDKLMVERLAAKVDVPVFVDQANDVGEIAEAKAIVKATASVDRQQYIPRSGIHGSSTLNATRNPAGADENWRALLAFLKRIAP
ncbi:alpha/beta hydrolase [uncultured Sphingomonas sp.]|uniref:alpha/beta hydrolase n=1 Tax=uncultured Sphingomonas sp. TaxID=158754 RepID=UPI0035CBDD37